MYFASVFFVLLITRSTFLQTLAWAACLVIAYLLQFYWAIVKQQHYYCLSHSRRKPFLIDVLSD